MLVRNKSILLNFSTSYSGGALSYLRNFISFVEQNNFENQSFSYILLVNESQLDYFKSTFIFKIYSDKSTNNSLLRYIKNYFYIKRIIKKEQVSLVFTPYQISFLFKDVINILMIRNMEPFLYSNYTYSLRSSFRNFFLKILSSYCLRKSDGIVSVSKYASDYITKNLNISASKIQIIHHGITPVYRKSVINDFEFIKNKLNIHDNFFICVGSMLPYRRFEDVIDAFDIIYPKLKFGTQLLIVGNGTDSNYLSKIKKHINTAKNSNHIVYIPNLAWIDFQIILANAKLVILSSEIEACPNLALETISNQVNIIACDIPPYREILKNTAKYYEARNVNFLSELIYDSSVNYYIHENKKEIISSFNWYNSFNSLLSYLNKECNNELFKYKYIF